jgi:Tfp pilus assembly protein PilW
MPVQPRVLSRRLRDERGFTLMEVLVAMGSATVLSMAVLGIVIVSVHLGSNYTDRVNANQQGRIAMEKIVQALQSSCVTPNLPPVNVGSSGSQISFYTALNDTPGPLPTQVTVSAPSGQVGALTLSSQTVTGSAPNWTASSQSPTTTTLVDYAAQTVQNGVSVPLFQYYAYSNGSISSTPIPVGPQGLTAAQAASTAMVTISFQAYPSDNYKAAGRPVDFSDSVTFRLTPPSSNSSATYVPCS